MTSFRPSALALAGVVLALASPPALASPTLNVVRDVSSATGRHVWYQQTVGGLPLHDAMLYVNQDSAGKQLDRTASLRENIALRGDYRLTEVAAKATAAALTGAPAGSRIEAKREAYDAGGGVAVPAWTVRVVFETGPGDFEVVIDATNAKAG